MVMSGQKDRELVQFLDLAMEPYGEYYRQVCLNSDTLYDFNGTNIKIVEHAVEHKEWGYHMFVMDGVHNTVLKNLL